MVKQLSRWLARLGTCANAGIIVGAIAGGLLALVDFREGGELVLTPGDALRFWAVTALFGWLVLLFVFVALARWTLVDTAWPALVNAVLVSGLTIYATRALDAYAWAWFVGVLIGLLIGLLLCTLYRRRLAAGG